MASPQRVFVGPYINTIDEFVPINRLEERVLERVKSISTHLGRLNRRTGGHLFDGAIILHPPRPAVALMAEALSKVIPAQTVASEHAYVLGNNPRVVKAPRDWLLQGAREALGDDWNGTPLISLTPSGVVDYLNQEWKPLDIRHPVGTEPLIELTEEIQWPVDPEQAKFEAEYFESQRLDVLASFGSL